MKKFSPLKGRDIELYASIFETPLGTMTAIADEKALYLLEFTDLGSMENEINRLQEELSMSLINGLTKPIGSIQVELKAYFKGTLKHFRTPIKFLGSDFQITVWKALRRIPYGETRSYANVAAFLGNPLAYRAVARANATCHHAIIIPCHRVINNNGALGGYGRGVHRKEWLITHEKNNLHLTDECT